MKQIKLLVLVIALLSMAMFSGSVQVIKPGNGEQLVLGKTYVIRWQSSGLSKTLKLTLWKNGSSVGVIKSNIPANAKQFNWTIGKMEKGSVVPGSGFNIKIKEKKSPTASQSVGSFSIVSKSTLPDNSIVQMNPNVINNPVKIVQPQYQVKPNILQIKQAPDTYGKLTPATDLVNFGASVDIKIHFKNATKVKVFNKNNGNLIYQWGNPTPGSQTVVKKVQVKAVSTEFSMEVNGPKLNYFAKCWVKTKPVVNTFNIVDMGDKMTVNYSFSGCEHGYLKRYDAKTRQWLRVAKIEGDGSYRPNQYPRTGRVHLKVKSMNKMRYKLVLIGVNGVVGSAEIVHKEYKSN